MDANSAIIEWDERFPIGIPAIDGQHQRLVQLTNNLHSACRKNPETANHHFTENAHEMVTYVRYHFSTEEKLMLLLDFPGYSDHKKEHESFIREILIQNQKFSEEKHLVPNRLVRFFKEWILSHIADCDKAMAVFFLNTKYHEKLELLLPRTFPRSA